MKKRKTYMTRAQLTDELSEGKRLELGCIMKDCCAESWTAQEVKSLIENGIGVKLTMSCADETQKYFRKLFKRIQS